MLKRDLQSQAWKPSCLLFHRYILATSPDSKHVLYCEHDIMKNVREELSIQYTAMTHSTSTYQRFAGMLTVNFLSWQQGCTQRFNWTNSLKTTFKHTVVDSHITGLWTVDVDVQATHVPELEQRVCLHLARPDAKADFLENIEEWTVMDNSYHVTLQRNCLSLSLFLQDTCFLFTLSSVFLSFSYFSVATLLSQDSSLP